VSSVLPAASAELLFSSSFSSSVLCFSSIPLSWEEFQERAERWWETKQSLIIQVRLLDEEAAAQNQKKKDKREMAKYEK